MIITDFDRDESGEITTAFYTDWESGDSCLDEVEALLLILLSNGVYSKEELHNAIDDAMDNYLQAREASNDIS